MRLAAIIMALLLAACTGDERDAATEASPTVTAPTSTEEREPGGVRYVPVEECPATVGTLRTWSGNWEELTYRQGPLWIALYPKGIVRATPDDVQEDGSIAMKFGWWRETKGRLAIEGRRLDAAAAAPLRAHVPTGYGRRGFQSTALIFSSPGCWEVTGSLGDAKLTFVTLVVASAR